MVFDAMRDKKPTKRCSFYCEGKATLAGNTCTQDTDKISASVQNWAAAVDLIGRGVQLGLVGIDGAVRPMQTGLSIGRVIPGLWRKLTPFGQRCDAVFFKCFSAG